MSGDGRVGPNAIVQLVESMRATGREPLAAAVLGAAGRAAWVNDPPKDMISQKDAARVHALLWQLTDAEEAAVIIADAGRRTADYVTAYRIPPVARRILKILPASVAQRMLLRSIARHAWTFAGSGSFRIAPSAGVSFAIAANPLAGPGGCRWHEAVFTQLWRTFISERATVKELNCCAMGSTACEFRVFHSAVADSLSAMAVKMP